jgi:hypothetical protein
MPYLCIGDVSFLWAFFLDAFLHCGHDRGIGGTRSIDGSVGREGFQILVHAIDGRDGIKFLHAQPFGNF